MTRFFWWTLTVSAIIFVLSIITTPRASAIYESFMDRMV